MEIKKAQVNLKLHFNDNKKLSIKNYRSIIYKEIEEKKVLEEFTDSKIEINIHPIPKKNSLKN